MSLVEVMISLAICAMLLVAVAAAFDASASACHGEPGGHIPRRVIKGGSHLCAPSYCLRYRPAARQGEWEQMVDGHGRSSQALLRSANARQ